MNSYINDFIEGEGIPGPPITTLKCGDLIKFWPKYNISSSKKEEKIAVYIKTTYFDIIRYFHGKEYIDKTPYLILLVDGKLVKIQYRDIFYREIIHG